MTASNEASSRSARNCAKWTLSSHSAWWDHGTPRKGNGVCSWAILKGTPSSLYKTRDVIPCPAAALGPSFACILMDRQTAEVRLSGKTAGVAVGLTMQAFGSTRAISAKAKWWRKKVGGPCCRADGEPQRKMQPIRIGEGLGNAGISCSKTDVPGARDVGRASPFRNPMVTFCLLRGVAGSERAGVTACSSYGARRKTAKKQGFVSGDSLEAAPFCRRLAAGWNFPPSFTVASLSMHGPTLFLVDSILTKKPCNGHLLHPRAQWCSAVVFMCDRA